MIAKQEFELFNIKKDIYLPLPGSGVVGGSGVVTPAALFVACVVVVRGEVFALRGLVGRRFDNRLVVFSRLLELDTKLFVLL